MTITHKHPVGATTYIGQWIYDNGHDAFAEYGQTIERESLDDLKRLLVFWRPSPSRIGQWWCRIDKGTYQDASFDDDEYGHVTAVSWEPDPDLNYVGSLTADGIVWDEQ
jgi:hypothetical protein